MKRWVLIISYKYLIKYFLRLFVGVKFFNNKCLQKETQFILVANHNSHLDTMSILSAMPHSIIDKVKPVAAQDHFGKTKWQTWLSNYFVNTLLIQRKSDKEHPENDPIYKMDKAIKEGYSLLIFPEGTRGEPDKPKEYKAGVAIVLKKNPNVPYVPIYLKGMGKAMPKGDNLIVPFESTVVFGTPRKIQSDNVELILQQMRNDIEELQNLIQ